MKSRAMMAAWGQWQRHCNEGYNTVADQGQVYSQPDLHCPRPVKKGRHKISLNYEQVGESPRPAFLTCEYCLANQNLTKFANYFALFPQVQGNVGQEIREPKGNNAIITRVKTPSPQWQGCLCINNGNHAIIIRANIAIMTTTKTLRIDGNNAIKTWVMPLAWGQAARATTLAKQWQRHACASTMAMMPSWREQQLPLQQQQRHLLIDGGNASLPMSHEGNDINDDKYAIAMRATTTAWGQQQCNHEEGNNTVTDQGQRRHCYEGDDIILTTARMPAHQQLQQCHHHEGDNCNGDNGKDACALTATTPLQWGHQLQLNDKQWGWQR
jgi:hypothetical protein